eukprot:GEMP01007894.1.p1 GENE.GEMP01007894.1~~GEMP01007894.1.p1  ORF type:complete len:811 (+),score=146.94 GEMP01007894.1:91-2523(+)
MTTSQSQHRSAHSQRSSQAARNARHSLLNDEGEKERKSGRPEVTLFSCIEQLACCEHVLWNLLDGLKTHASHVSFFCREYWNSAASQSQISLDRYFMTKNAEPASSSHQLRKQVSTMCILESLSLGILSYYASGTMDNVSSQVSKRLQQMIYYVHENCLILMDYICTKWISTYATLEKTNGFEPRPDDLNLEILIRINRYRKVRRGDHVMALRQQNEMLINTIKELTRGGRKSSLTDRKASNASDKLLLTPNGQHRPMSSRDAESAAQAMRAAKHPPQASPTGDGRASLSHGYDVLSIVADVVSSRSPIERRKVLHLRNQINSVLRFRPLVSEQSSWNYNHTFDGNEDRSAGEFKAQVVYFEPLPPMLPKLDSEAHPNNMGVTPMLPRLQTPEIYTLVLDLDETLVHYFEVDGQGYYEQRPGCYEFLQRMNTLGFEVVVFTAATQDYADWVIDQIDPAPHRLVHYRLYRQNALPWGPIFVKDLRRLGRDLNKTIIIDNVAENFMLQPANGIFIAPWYEDPTDRVLETLTPLLEDLLTSRDSVPKILDKYKNDIHRLAGHPTDPSSQDADNTNYGYELEEHEVDPRQMAPSAAKLPVGHVPHRIAPAVLQPTMSPFSTVLPSRQPMFSQSLTLGPYKTSLQGFRSLNSSFPHTVGQQAQQIQAKQQAQQRQQAQQKQQAQQQAHHQHAQQQAQQQGHQQSITYSRQPVKQQSPSTPQQTINSSRLSLDEKSRNSPATTRQMVTSGQTYTGAPMMPNTISSARAVPKGAMPTGPSPHGSPTRPIKPTMPGTVSTAGPVSLGDTVLKQQAAWG